MFRWKSFKAGDKVKSYYGDKGIVIGVVICQIGKDVLIRAERASFKLGGQVIDVAFITTVNYDNTKLI